MGRAFFIFLCLYLGKLVWNSLAYGMLEHPIAQAPLVETVKLAANLQKPAGYENSPGSNQYLDVSGLDAIVVPSMVGRVADPAAMEQFLKGSGFHVKIVRYETSQMIPEGMIMSQTPEALKEVKSKGAIRVVVSTGKNKECADILNKDKLLRSTFQKPGVDVRNICRDLGKSANGMVP